MTGVVKRAGRNLGDGIKNNTQGILSEILPTCRQGGAVLKHIERAALHAKCHKWCEEIC